MKKTIVITMLTLFLFSTSVLADSFGASPSRIEIENALRGSIIEKSITFSSSTLKDPVNYVIGYEGMVGQWASSKYGETFVLDPKLKRTEVTFVFQVPRDIPNGKYTGKIIATPVADGISHSGRNSAAVSAGVVLLLEFDVSGEQIQDFEVIQTSIPHTEEEMKAYLVIDIKNNGNVVAKPSYVELDIIEKYEKTVLKTIKFTEFEEGIQPFSRGDIYLPFEHGLPTDLYWAAVRVYREGVLVHEDLFTFRILEVGKSNIKTRLLKLTATENPVVDKPVKLTGVVKNSGNIISQCNLKAEVKLKKQLLDVLESDKLLIEPKEEKNISIYYTPDFQGKYSAKAFARCSGVDSNSRTVRFEVTNPYAQLGIPMILVVIITLVVVLIGVAKNKKKRE